MSRGQHHADHEQDGVTVGKRRSGELVGSPIPWLPAEERPADSDSQPDQHQLCYQFTIDLHDGLRPPVRLRRPTVTLNHSLSASLYALLTQHAHAVPRRLREGEGYRLRHDQSRARSAD